MYLEGTKMILQFRLELEVVIYNRLERATTWDDMQENKIYQSN